MLKVSPGTELCLAVGNQRGRVFCPGRGSNLGISIGAAVWRGSQLTAPDYSNAWPDMVAPELPLAPGTSFSVPWMSGLICLLGEVVNAKSKPKDSQQVPERETAYKTMLSRWFAPEDFDIIVSDLRNDLAAKKISPDAAIEPLWQTAQSPQHLLALLDVLEPYKGQLAPKAYGQRAVLRSVGLVDAGRYQEGLDAALQALEDPLLPGERRPEILNAQGRCYFHLRNFAAARAAYQAGIEAAGPANPFRAQLYINLGNAMQGDMASFISNRKAAIAALEQGVALADSPRLQVEGRSSLSTAFINSGELDPAMRVLDEAWKIADGNQRVADKGRIMVLRNIATVQILKGLQDLGIATMEDAIRRALSYYGPCHPEMIDLYRFAFALYVEGLFSAGAVAERVLRVMQTAQRAKGVGCAAANAYAQIALENLIILARRQAVEEKVPEIRQRLNSYTTQALDDVGISSIVSLVTGEAS